jgi:hypothetical protein
VTCSDFDLLCTSIHWVEWLSFCKEIVIDVVGIQSGLYWNWVVSVSVALYVVAPPYCSVCHATLVLLCLSPSRRRPVHLCSRSVYFRLWVCKQMHVPAPLTHIVAQVFCTFLYLSALHDDLQGLYRLRVCRDIRCICMSESVSFKLGSTSNPKRLGGTTELGGSRHTVLACQ